MNDSKFLPKQCWIYLTVIVGIFIFMQIVPYNRYVSILIQLAVAGFTVLFYMNRPVVSLASILILHAVTSDLFYSQNNAFQNYYQLNSTVVIVMCLILFLYRFWRNMGHSRSNRISKTTFILAFFMCFSLIWAGDITYYNSDFFIIPILYATIPYFIEDEYDIRFAWMSFSIANILFSLKMIQNTLTLGTIYDIGASIDRNYLSLFSIIGFMATAIVLFQNRKKPNKFFLLVAAATLVVSVYLILTFASRTAFIILLLFAALLFLQIISHNKRALIIVVFLSAIVIWWVFVSDAASFMIERFSDSTVSNANNRTDIATLYLTEFASQNFLIKIFGQGYKVFSASFFGIKFFSHNSYLGMLVDFGLIGLILYLSILYRTGVRLWFSNNRIIFISFITIIVYMFALEVHQDVAGICFLTTCVGIADVSRKSNIKLALNVRGRI